MNRKAQVTTVCESCGKCLILTIGARCALCDTLEDRKAASSRAHDP